MNNYLCKVEEIIELNSENASYYMAQARQGIIKIRGKFIRDANGKLRPVLVKTFYQQLPTAQSLDVLEPSWGKVPTEVPMKRENRRGGLLKLFKSLFN